MFPRSEKPAGIFRAKSSLVKVSLCAKFLSTPAGLPGVSLMPASRRICAGLISAIFRLLGGASPSGKAALFAVLQLSRGDQLGFPKSVRISSAFRLIRQALSTGVSAVNSARIFRASQIILRRVLIHSSSPMLAIFGGAEQNTALNK